jgi:hypothetical protein
MMNTTQRKRPMLAALLQCIPLLAAGGCVVNGASNQQGAFAALILWWAALFWGLGYFYVGRRARWRGVVALAAGPLLAYSACTASFAGVSYDYEHSYRTPSAAPINEANRASVQTGLIVAAAVLLMAVDAWRLAAVDEPEAPRSDEA